MSKIAGELNAEMSKTIGSKEYNEWLNSPLTKALKRSFEQSITDPENQPSQYGTVTLAMYEHLEEQITASQQRVAELEKERDRLSGLCDKWNFECDEMREDNKRLANVADVSEITKLREQVAAQAAVIEKLTKRLASTNIIMEVVCAIHPDSACAKYELAENMNALAISTDSTTSPLEIEL